MALKGSHVVPQLGCLLHGSHFCASILGQRGRDVLVYKYLHWCDSKDAEELLGI